MASETFQLRFTPRDGAALELAAALVSHNAQFGQRVASHKYLHRDGAEQEPMGAEPARVTYRFCFVGPGFATKYRAFIAAVRKQPRGQLIDPLFGQMAAVCLGISDANRDLSREKNAINVTASFEEDALDAQVTIGDPPAPAAAVAAIKPRRTLAQTAAAPFTVAGVSVATLLSKVDLFVSAAGEVIAGASSVALVTRLGAVAIATDAAVTAVLSATNATGARAYSAVARLIDLYVACVDADRAIAASRPPIIKYTVSSPTSVYVLAARLYGAQRASAKAAEILAANRISDPLWIAAGTELRITQPGV